MRKSFVVACQAIIVIFLAVALSSLPVLAATGTVRILSDNETVYVLMNSDGSSQKTILMDWLRVEGTGTYDFRDPVPGAQDVRLVDGSGILAFEGGSAHITGTSSGLEDIYYRATLAKSLPVDVHVTTTLSGKEISYADLKKQAGDVTVTIGLTNNEKQGSVYVPWTCSLTLTLDNADVRSIDAGTDGVTVVTGSRTIVTYVVVLDASAQVTLRYTALRGTDPDLQLAIRPSMPDFPLPSASSLVPLKDGLGQIALAFDGQKSILDGVIKALDSQMVPTFDVTQLDRLNDLVTLLKADEAVLRGVYASIDTTQLESLSALTLGISAASNGDQWRHSGCWSARRSPDGTGAAGGQGPGPQRQYGTGDRWTAGGSRRHAQRTHPCTTIVARDGCTWWNYAGSTRYRSRARDNRREPDQTASRSPGRFRRIRQACPGTRSTSTPCDGHVHPSHDDRHGARRRVARWSDAAALRHSLQRYRPGTRRCAVTGADADQQEQTVSHTTRPATHAS